MHHEGHQGGGGGCPKCIINIRLVAIAADLLASGLPDGDALGTAAIELRDASISLGETYDYLIDRKVLTVKASHPKWDGCNEASEVMAMVTATKTHGFDSNNSSGFVDRLKALRIETVHHMTSLIEGTAP
jgi:hypothetical protein